MYGHLCDHVRPCVVIYAIVFDHVRSSVRLCAVRINFVRPCSTMCGHMYDRVRLCTAVFEQNICAMMFEHVRPFAMMSDHVRPSPTVWECGAKIVFQQSTCTLMVYMHRVVSFCFVLFRLYFFIYVKL